MAKIDIAHQQLRFLQRMEGKYTWVQSRWRTEGRRFRVSVFGPQGVEEASYGRYDTYLYEVYRAAEEVSRQEHGRVPTIEEMILVWQDEIQRLERLARAERREGKRRYILRSDGPGMPGLGE